MSTSIDRAPTSRVRFATARTDITPPIGIYHRMWGAAQHDRATGIHRPLYADVLIFGAVDAPDQCWLQVQLDMVGLAVAQHQELVNTIAEAANLPSDRVTVAYSHTHSGGVFLPDRRELPGGEMIEPYLQKVNQRVAAAVQQAMPAQQEAVLTYGTGRSDMAANRDYWDAQNQIFACGYNPDGNTNNDVVVARVTAKNGDPLATIVNYSCHPTTLAWENTMISPDYVGAMREEVERTTHSPCVFLLGACGDLGPRRSHLGDTAIADRNGRQLAHAVLAVLEGLEPAATDLAYQGPVVSGATLGTWSPQPHDSARQLATSVFQASKYIVELPQKPRPDPQSLHQEIADWSSKQAEADAQGDTVAARDYGARAERARRWLLRQDDMSPGSSFAYSYSILQAGDALWIGLQGEPYSDIQTELRRKFAPRPVMVTAMAGPMSVAYLLPDELYGKGLYQEEPSILAQGCLERLTDAVAEQVGKLA